MAKCIKKLHLPALCKAQNQTRDYAVVDGTLGHGADKAELGGHACEAISFAAGFRPTRQNRALV